MKVLRILTLHNTYHLLNVFLYNVSDLLLYDFHRVESTCLFAMRQIKKKKKLDWLLICLCVCVFVCGIKFIMWRNRRQNGCQFYISDAQFFCFLTNKIWNFFFHFFSNYFYLSSSKRRRFSWQLNFTIYIRLSFGW